MITVTLCVGSSCSVRGSDEFAADLERILEKRGLSDEVRLVGAFCMDQCSKGISVRVEDQQYGEIHFLSAESFFEKEILPRLHSEERA